MKKKTVLAVSILAVCFIFLRLQLCRNTQVMGAPVFSEQEMKRIQAGRSPFGDGIQTELQIEGVKGAFEKEENRYYIPKNMEENYWKGSITSLADGTSASVAWLEDSAFQNMEEAVAGEHIFRCLIYNDAGYRTVSVLFTGIPVMRIDGNMGEQGARIAVFDPVLSVRGGYQAEESLAYYNIRGNASKRFEKIGYRLELFYDDGRKGKDVSLLGMRSDNDWQLKAMYSDRSKLRDKLSVELWNQIAARTETKADKGCRMEYLELIVNGEYRGLYGLVEPTDYKALELDRARDLIYKAGSDEWPDDRLFDQSEAEQSFVCAGIHIRQAGRTYYPGLWEPFRTFWNSGYELESEKDLNILYGCIDRQNFINYALYYNAIAGVDNRFKNIIYSAVQNPDGAYTIRRIPWDQNYSWGDDFEQGEEKDIKNIRYNPELAKKWLNEEVFRNMQEYDKRLPEDMLETWRDWRESFLKEELWKSYAREQMGYLVESGAFSRDTLRWPDSENAKGTEEIEKYIDVRFSWLDNYLRDLSEQ